MIHFDFDSRYPNELVVGSAISRREGFVWSVVAHLVALVFLSQLARLMVVLEPQPEPPSDQQIARLNTPDSPRIVFIDPRLDKPAPPRRPELSDLDRRAETRERPETPRNPLPFSKGNSPERVEPAPPPEEARAEDATPPAPPQPTDPLPRQESQIARTAPAPPGPARTPEPARPNPRGLGRAIQNPQAFLSRDAFDNPQGGDLDTSSSFQFDSKGIDFGSWLRRFKLQVTGNWVKYIPLSAMVNHGHVFLQFYVHKDGTLSDIRVILPSEFSEFTRVADYAIRASNPTAPLPADYPDDKMLMRVGFFYNERPPD